MRYLGRVTVKTNGIILDSRPGASLALGGVNRNSVVGDQQMGYSEEPVASRVECELSVKAGDEFETIRNMTDGTCTFECDTGQSYLVRGAYLESPPTITGNEGGRVKISIVGQPAEQIG